MKVSILTTDGGPHSAEKLAAATAGNIIEIAASASGAQEIEGRKLELKILEILEKYHDELQKKERDHLQAHGVDGLSHDFDPTKQVDIEAALKEIVDAGKQSSWSSHFNDPGVSSYIKSVLTKDFATSIHIERLWHCDRNIQDDKAKAFKAVYHS